MCSHLIPLIWSLLTYKNSGHHRQIVKLHKWETPLICAFSLDSLVQTMDPVNLHENMVQISHANERST